MPFRDVIGHRKLVALLSRSIARDSIPPSLIFAGPAGVGKRLVALSVAQAVNCLDPRQPKASQPDGIEYDACGVCPACARIARNVHPDALTIEPGENGSIKVDAVRDVVERAGYRPFEGRRRVVVIDDADGMVASAQNALLKTLEEPPSASLFILVSARPDSLLPTVLSRCPRLRFRPLGPEDVAAALMRAGQKEAEAHAIAALADGSIGAALNASAEELVDARDAALRFLIQSASTDDLRRRVESAKDLLPSSSGGAAADREYLAVHLRAMASLLRDAELVGAGADRRSLANPDVESSLARLGAFRGERGIQAFGAVDEALLAIERNQGVKIIADWVATQI